MALVPFVGRLDPGATEEWNAFADEMFIHRREEYLASRRRLGVIKERVLLQRGPDGDAVIYAFTVHGVAPEPVDNLFRVLAESRDEFDVWYKRRMKELHGLDFDA